MNLTNLVSVRVVTSELLDRTVHNAIPKRNAFLNRSD